MARKRLNDTAALQSVPDSGARNSHVSVSVRKIDNGYVTTTCRDDGAEWKSTETYSAKRPNLDIGNAQQEPAVNTLKDTMRYLGD